MERISLKQYRAEMGLGSKESAPEKPKRSKYNNTRHEFADGNTADSTKEGWRFIELQKLEATGRIRNLKAGNNKQKYRLEIDGVHICDYVPDAVYEEFDGQEWRVVVEDTKGFRTPVYKLKKKLMKAIHNIDIREI